MPYCKLINIKLANYQSVYKINISNQLKFRFITPDNINGIEFKTFSDKTIKTEIINNIISGKENWYIFDKTIDFSPLNEYKYLILQLYAEKDIKCFEIEKNDSFIITLEKEWYNCNNMTSSCGLQLTNEKIDKNKPIQEVKENLKYLTYGDATLIKNKYLKAGKTESRIVITGFKNYAINYISDFDLMPVRVNNNKIEKKVKSLNSLNNLDKMVSNGQPYDINNKLEMIKFQLKNYFTENNYEIAKLECSVEDQEKINLETKKEVEMLEQRIYYQDKHIEDNVNNFNKVNIDVENVKNCVNEQKEENKLTKERVDKVEVRIEENYDEIQKFGDNFSEKLKSQKKHFTERLDEQNERLDEQSELISDNFNTLNDKIDINNDTINKNFDKLVKTDSYLNNQLVIQNNNLESLRTVLDNHLNEYGDCKQHRKCYYGGCILHGHCGHNNCTHHGKYNMIDEKLLQISNSVSENKKNICQLSETVEINKNTAKNNFIELSKQIKDSDSKVNIHINDYLNNKENTDLEIKLNKNSIIQNRYEINENKKMFDSFIKQANIKELNVDEKLQIISNQLKNSIIDLNNKIDKQDTILDSKIKFQVDSLNKKIDENNDELINVNNRSYKNLDTKINAERDNIINLNSKVESLNTDFNKQINDKVDNAFNVLKTTININKDDTNKKFINLEEILNLTDNRLNDTNQILDKTSLLINNHISEYNERISKINTDDIIVNEINLTEYVNKSIEQLYDKINDEFKLIFNPLNIYDNIDGKPYCITSHSQNLTINFLASNKTYKLHKFYLFIDDYCNKIVPYYCYSIESSISSKLTSIAKFTPIVLVSSIFS